MDFSFDTELAALRDSGLYRKIRLVTGGQGKHVELSGHRALLFCSNNYLGLADHPALIEAAARGALSYGAGSGAARLVSGNGELHVLLEERLAAFKRTERALLFNSGYSANTGIIQALVGKGDTIFSDRLNHASIIDGAILSRAKTVRYPHNDMQTLRRLLEQAPATGRRLIVTDGVFSMDGDVAPLAELVKLKTEFGAFLMVDDAHGTGVLGDCGRGSVEASGVAEGVDLQMGTLGKALGSFGAFAAASAEVIDFLVNKARSFIFSTSLPPAVLAASLAALDVVESAEGAHLRKRLAENTRLFRDALQDAGFRLAGTTHIVPIITGDAEKTMQYTSQLLEKGFFVQGIRPPTVPAGSCRLRCTLMATHTDDDISSAVAALVSTIDQSSHH